MNKLLTKTSWLVAITSITLVGAACAVPSPRTSTTIPQTGSPTETSPNQAPEPSGDNLLDLSNQNLSKLPSYVLQRTELTELNISNNILTGALPGEIRFLKNLTKLDMSHNKLTGIPAEVGQLSKLTELDLSYNEFTGLPYELGNLKNLKILNLTGNNYAQADLDKILEGLPNVTVIK